MANTKTYGLELIMNTKQYMKRIPLLFLTGMLFTGLPLPCLASSREEALTGETLSEEKSLMEAQDEMEKELLEWYDNSSCKTLDTAQVHQDLYGTAPLTAVILFETENPETVTVTVHGKDPAGNITYVTEESTWHEVQIFGLYADWDNLVTLETSSGQSRDFEITTEPLPDTMSQVKKTSGTGTQLENHLFYVCDQYRTVFDQNGDVRWYMAGLSTAFSGIDEIDPENHCFWFSTEGTSQSMATVYCMSFTGRIRGIFFTLGKSAHHDGTLLPDGRLLYYSKWGKPSSELSILDPSDGSVSLYYDPQELFDEDLGSLEYATKDHAWDFTHANTVEYLAQNDSLLLSFRNQHVVMDMDFSTKNINWVLTPAYSVDASGNAHAFQEKLTDALILPDENDTGFEWFYSQHAPRLISYEEETDVYDIVLLDNGTDRFVADDSSSPEETDEKYSRLVRYQIDAKNRSVTQIYQYGQDHPEYYSDQCGSAQYLEENGHYIASFPGLEEQDSRISFVTESDSDGKEIAEYQITNTSDGIYRAFSCDASVFAEEGSTLRSPENYMTRYNLLDETWKKSDYPVSAGSESYSISEITLTDQGLSIRGFVREKEARNKNHTFRLIARNENGDQYSFSLIRFRKFRFYMPGIPMNQLPEGTYQLAIYAEVRGEVLGCTEIPYQYVSKTASDTGETLSDEPASETTAEKNAANTDTNQGDTLWEIRIQEATTADSLQTTVPVTQYDGSVDQVPYSNAPADGHIYVLLHLDVVKAGKGTGSFSWDKVSLQDENGNCYTRINDSFLSDHGYDRMAGTDIKIGSKSGWICFEIPADSAEGALTLLYKEEGQEIELLVPLQAS